MGFTNEVLSDGTAAEGHHFLLDIAGLDHYFGGLVHREEGAPPDHVALAAFNRVSAQFLDAYLKDDASAAGCLMAMAKEPLAEGRGRLSVR